jgi:predicted RNA binding protein YcfA (HicA-like mRNA interferase family)
MPSAKVKDFWRMALLLGFVFKRTTGSHERATAPDDRALAIPLDGGSEMGPPLFFKMLRQLGLTFEEFSRTSPSERTRLFARIRAA